MKEIGLSSGKFSMYMMLGLPTIVTPCKVYEELIKKYRFGAVINDVSQLGEKLDEISNQKNESNLLYESILNPINQLNSFVKCIEM